MVYRLVFNRTLSIYLLVHRKPLSLLQNGHWAAQYFLSTQFLYSNVVTQNLLHNISCQILTLAAVSCSPASYCTSGVKMGLGLMGQLGHAWVGAWGGARHGTIMTPYLAPHAPTYARPSWPINPNPNLIPLVQYRMGLHDTAAPF